MEKKAIVRVEKTNNDNRTCRCCTSVATTCIELGQNFNKIVQTNIIYLCDEHATELKESIDKIQSL